jgi:esterase/lipase superfamily enzyme
MKSAMEWKPQHLFDRPVRPMRLIVFELATLDEDERQILVYLHGYNVTFEDAALRAAQLGFDLKIEGATAFFAWPSCGDLADYFADADRIAASEKAFRPGA